MHTPFRDISGFPHLVPRMLSSLGVRHGALSFDDLARPWEQLWGEWSVSVSV